MKSRALSPFLSAIILFIATLIVFSVANLIVFSIIDIDRGGDIAVLTDLIDVEVHTPYIVIRVPIKIFGDVERIQIAKVEYSVGGSLREAYIYDLTCIVCIVDRFSGEQYSYVELSFAVEDASASPESVQEVYVYIEYLVDSRMIEYVAKYPP